MKLQITSEIRGEERKLVWSDGLFSGDKEFLDRVSRCAEGLRVDLTTADSVDVIRVCQDATPAPVHIVSLANGAGRVLDFTDHSRDETFSAPA